MARKRKNKPLSVTQRLRNNALKALARRQKKGIPIPDSLKSRIKSASAQTLKHLSANRYRALDEQLTNIQTPSGGTIDDRYNYLVQQNIIAPTSPQEADYYKSVIEYAINTSYGELSEASKLGAGYKTALAKEALSLSAKSPEAFNTIFNKSGNYEPPTPDNTIETSTLVYDSVMQRIDEAYSTGTGAEEYLAKQLEKMIQEEIAQYGFDKVIQGMQYADGDLLERIDGYFLDSEQWVNDAWKGSLLSMAQLIHGYIDDATIEQMSALAELIEGFGEV